MKKIPAAIKKTAKVIYKKAMTPRDLTEGGKYKVHRVGNQIVRSKVKK